MAVFDKGTQEKWRVTMQLILEKMEIAGNDEIALLDEDFHKNLMLATDNSFWITIMDAVIGVYREWINKVLEKSDAEDYKKLLKSHSLIFSGLVGIKEIYVCTLLICIMILLTTTEK